MTRTVVATETRQESVSASDGRNTTSATSETVLTSDERGSPKVVATRFSRLHRPRLLLQPLPPQRSQLPTTLRCNPITYLSLASVDTKMTRERRFLLARHLHRPLREATRSAHVTTLIANPNAEGTPHPKKLLWTLTKNTDDAFSRKQNVLAAALATRTATLTARRSDGGRRMSVTGLEVLKTARVRLLPGIAL